MPAANIPEEENKKVVAFRRHLHEHPEISGQERQTSDFICQRLGETNPDRIIRFDNYGVAALYKGHKPGKTILLRAETDALPIEETNSTLPYRSKNKGVSHKCGHDGHSAILYGLARSFREGLTHGEVILLFQPAEENGKGAEGIINDPKFKTLHPEVVVALHNLPGFPLHALVVKEGPFTAAVNSIIIHLQGKTSHAAEPEHGINPSLAMAEITREFHAINIPDPSLEDFQLITPVYSRMGEKSYGVSAGEGELHYTLRAWDNSTIRNLEQTCASLAQKIAEKHGLTSKISWTESFFANINNPGLIKSIKTSASALGLEVTEVRNPFKWGEDFGIFTEKFPGAMFGLGAGEACKALHNPDYDFPDKLIATGISIFTQLIKELNNS